MTRTTLGRVFFRVIFILVNSISENKTFIVLDFGIQIRYVVNPASRY